MVSIGERITQLRKAKNWSQDELAKEVESSKVMIGKYERGDNLPSIEVIVKLAKAFEVSVDFLLGEGLNAAYDKEMVKRLDELEHLPADEKQRIFHYMDLIIRDYKTKKTYNNK
jgi:transcriptional regulator with XRE-family HTH domain